MNIKLPRDSRWTIVSTSRNGKHVYAEVTCSCPDRTTKTVRVDKLKSGRSKSCGCLRREVAARTGRDNAGRVHTWRTGPAPDPSGATGHSLYQTWAGMMQRCYNPRNTAYRYYGGRGITVFEPWHDAARFIADVESLIGPRPEGAYDTGRPLWTLDRIDNDRGYEPGNLRWATQSEQMHNRSPRRKVLIRPAA